MKMRVGVGVEMGGMFPLRDIHLDLLLLHIKVQVKRPGGILLEVRVDYHSLLKLMLRARLLDLGLGLGRGRRRRGRREVLGRLRRKRRRGRKREELVMPVYVSSMPLLVSFFRLGQKEISWLTGRERRRLDVISYHLRKLWVGKHYVHTVNNILWNVLSSSL